MTRTDMDDFPAATPLQPAAEAWCSANGLDPNEREPGSVEGAYRSRKHAALPGLAAAIDSYCKAILDEPFFLNALARAIDPAAAPEEQARSLVEALRPENIAALFPGFEGSSEDATCLDGMHIEWIDGSCPIQAEGSIDGQDLYFRARGSSWALYIGPKERHFSAAADQWVHQEPYRVWPDAGYMTPQLAMNFIVKAARLWRASRTNP